jgi:hypothetical protein
MNPTVSDRTLRVRPLPATAAAWWCPAWQTTGRPHRPGLHQALNSVTCRRWCSRPVRRGRCRAALGRGAACCAAASPFPAGSFTDLMRSPIIRRSSSIWVSPGPTAMPMPPAGAPGGSIAAPGGSKGTAAREFDLQLAFVTACTGGKDVEDQPVRSATGTPRCRSRLRCCAGLSA